MNWLNLSLFSHFAVKWAKLKYRLVPPWPLHASKTSTTFQFLLGGSSGCSFMLSPMTKKKNPLDSSSSPLEISHFPQCHDSIFREVREWCLGTSYSDKWLQKLPLGADLLEIKKQINSTNVSLAHNIPQKCHSFIIRTVQSLSRYFLLIFPSFDLLTSLPKSNMVTGGSLCQSCFQHQLWCCCLTVDWWEEALLIYTYISLSPTRLHYPQI